MADRKPGKVIRVDPLTWKYVTERRRKGETLSALMRRLIGLPSKKGIVEARTNFVLPSDLFDSAAAARGASVIRAVRLKKKKIEEPVAVRAVL